MLTSDLAQSVFAPLLRGRPEEAATQEFLVIPGKGTPRWLLPESRQNVGPALANWSPYRLTSRMKWAAIRTAHFAGCLTALPGASRINIHGVEDIDWRSVGWSSGVPPVPVVYMGTPSVSRKAVIHLVNPASGACDLIVKVPLAKAARAAILREADVLAILAEENYNYAPRPVYADRETGITSQTAFNGKAGGRKFTDEYWAPLSLLIRAGERTAIVGHAMEWREQLDKVAASGADIATMTAAISELGDVEPLPACWVHGDFAPWNIRRLPDGAVALLDWEDAQRSGLPLQDGFHFLHMQDYLFGARPTAHAADVERFARAIGITAEQCRKLEIAYLAHAYLRRLAVGECEHCAFLLATLRFVLREQRRFLVPKVGFPITSSSERAATPPLTSHIRSDLFAAVIAQLTSAGVPYCVLSGHENHVEGSSSDVDFMFAPRDMDRIAPLLAQATKRAGALLVQAIPHETSACYFVVARDDGSEIGYFDPDCAGDYRAQGRLWLSAERMLGRRRQYRELYVPAVADEFAYYLIKKVLKQSVADFQLRRLRHLYQRDPVNCRAEIGKFWSLATVRAIERALAGDLEWLKTSMPCLLAELKSSAPVESLRERVIQKLRDGVRVLGRVLHPTGVSVLICGGEKQIRSAIAEGLLHQLAPAFRRVANVESQSASLGLAARVFTARLQSTLVVSHGWDGNTLARLSSFAARLLFQPDLIFVVTGDEEPTFPGADRHLDFCSTAHKTHVVYLNSGFSREQNVRLASRAILHWLAARQERRLSLKYGHPAESMANSRTEKLAEPVGLHLVE